LFLGGWNVPFGLIGYLKHQRTIDETWAGLFVLNIVGAAIFVTKAMAIIFVQMWLRWTLPRPRIDQVLYACVKVLLPMACVLLLGAAVWQWLIIERPGIPWRDYNPWNFADWYHAGYLGTLITQVILALIGLTGFGAVVMWVLYAAASGRNLKQRLTDPEPIDQVPANLATAAK
jgi:hypothetical protein